MRRFACSRVSVTAPTRSLMLGFHRFLFDQRGARKFDGYPNFGRSIFGRIEADFCNERLILQHYSRATRLTRFCTAPKSTFAVFQLFSSCSRFLCLNFPDFWKCQGHFTTPKFRNFRLNIAWNFAENPSYLLEVSVY